MKHNPADTIFWAMLMATVVAIVVLAVTKIDRLEPHVIHPAPSGTVMP